MVNVVYLARLREALGVDSEEVALAETVRDVAGLTQWLRSRGGNWAQELAPGRPIRVAVNHKVAEPGTAVADGDEVAFFPPVTGGSK